jgi:hydroxymethylglutaryl-CoA synthase
MLVCKNPRLLELDPKVTSTITRDERDFFRPNGMSTAVVDGKYSIDVYLDCIEEAAERYLERARLALHQPTAALADILDHFVFHVPFPRMSEYAAARVLGQSWLQDPALKADLAAQAPLGFTPMPSSAEKRAFEKQLTATPLFKTFFAKWVEASLTIPRRVGNIYSGSMYLSLASLLESREDRAKLAGQRVGFFSYGSGASARVFSGVFKNPEQGYHPHLNEQLLNRNDGGKRISLSLANYERLHRGPEGEGLKSLLQPAPSVRPPQREFAIVRIGNETHAAKNDLGYRYYDWVN